MTTERQLGDARDADEVAIEAAIGRVPDWAGRAVRYRMLVGGLSNRNWLITVDGHPRRYFVKVPGPGTEKFIDRGVAHQAAVNAHAMGLAPEVVFFDPSDGLEVHEFLEDYAACTNADFENAAIQEAVIASYRQLNAGPKLRLTKTIFEMIEEHWRDAQALGALLPHDFPWLMSQYEKAKAAFMASGLDLVPCFNDPMPGNFLVCPGKPMKLVDFEFASNNERAYELGVFLGEMFFTEERSLELIEAYYGEARQSTVARVWLGRALADIKWGGWAIQNRMLTDWDFDYQKYGDWKLARARSVILDPRWEWWLRSI
ncbi:MAG TPA: phosphotransferase [Geminicoccus sp.]|jgi:thiamine kinase-like enzyme|uniref:phosphotransferase n=1 Tax=Geminicoccus sp. TaxID=2024832 RepID=UPI002E2F1780|nr:phosphotransferase [Geminicoccus sp.]HEX2529028.1 phosphotransferase [Geminicoccus sp.]